MSNDLATLNALLDSRLRDTSDETWTSAEKNTLIQNAVRNLSPRIVRPLDPESYTQALTAGDYFYALNSAIVHLSRVDWLDADSEEMGPIRGELWEVVGNTLDGTAKIHVSPTIVDQGGTLRYTGYGRYDTTTNYIPDDYVELVIAEASKEALKMLMQDRARFLQHGVTNQTQNISVTELVTMMNAAEQRAREERQRHITFRRPVMGRV